MAPMAILMDDTTAVPEGYDVDSSRVTPFCMNWPYITTNLQVFWNDQFDWVTIYRKYDCDPKEGHVTVSRAGAKIVDGVSCEETQSVIGVKGVNTMANGSILFGRGDIPAAVKFTPSLLSTSA